MAGFYEGVCRAN